MVTLLSLYNFISPSIKVKLLLYHFLRHWNMILYSSLLIILLVNQVAPCGKQKGMFCERIINPIFWKTCASKILNDYIFLLSKDYRLITDKGDCIHSNRKVLHHCYKFDVNFVDCAAACSGFNWCIGFSIYAGANDFCSLIPSRQYFCTCPGGYTEQFKHNPAETADDLVASYSSFAGWSCHSKIPGIIHLILFDHYSYVYHNRQSLSIIE